MSWPFEIACHAVLSLGSASRVWSTTASCAVCADDHLARIGLLLAGDQLEERRLARAVRSNHADDRPRRHLEREIADQQSIAVALRHGLELDHLVAEPLGDRNEDLGGLVAFLVFVGRELVEARDARLALGLPTFRVLPHPFELLLHRLDPRHFLLRFGFEPGFLLFEPGAVVAFPRNAIAAVELEDPFGGVVEEIAVVRHRDHRAREFLQVLLEPVDTFRVEVIRGFIEEQHVGLRQEQAAQRNASLLAARQIRDRRVPRRQAQCVGGDLHLHAGVGTGGRDDRLELRLLRGKRVEVGALLGVGRVDLVETLLRAQHFAHSLLDGCAYRLRGIELRLLRQESDAQIRHRHRFAFVFAILAGHDPQQRRLAGSVETQHADLGARKERERDVLQDHPLGRNDLAHAVHRVNVLRHANARNVEDAIIAGRGRSPPERAMTPRPARSRSRPRPPLQCAAS